MRARTEGGPGARLAALAGVASCLLGSVATLGAASAVGATSAVGVTGALGARIELCAEEAAAAGTGA